MFKKRTSPYKLKNDENNLKSEYLEDSLLFAKDIRMSPSGEH